MTGRRFLRRTRRALTTLLRDTRGATAVEYGLVLVLIVVAMIAALQNLAGTTIGVWNNVSTKVSAAN